MALDNEPVCRLCDKHTTDLVSIFTKNAAGQQILHLVKKCFPIIIYRSDPLSKFICTDCLDNIYNFYAFKQLVDDVITQQKFKLEQTKKCRSTLLYLNSLHENEENGNWSTGIPRSDRSTSTEDFCPVKSVDVHSLLDVECNSYTDIDVNTNSKNEDISNENEHEHEASDMEAEEHTASINSTIKSQKRIATRIDCDGAPYKRRRLLVGPKSAKESVTDEDIISDDPALKYYRRIYYEPHSLMQSCLNLFNSLNVPDYYYERCRKVVETVEEMQNFCKDCETEFETEREFVEHENCRHLRLTLHRVDDLVYWPATNRDNYVRNLWLQCENPDTDIPEPEDDLLVPLADTSHHHHHHQQQQPQYRPMTASGGSINEITYIADKVYINGVPLGQVGKKDRLYLYQTIRIQNIQRKFCTECRFTFKDNWAMDKHYTTLACLYTCRYCGRRFNSMRQVFDNHVQMHVDSGHSKSEKIFASNRRNDPNPRIINPATVRFLSPQQVVSKRGNRYQKSLNHLHKVTKVFEQRAGIRPVKLQNLLRDAAVYDEDVKVKGEPTEEDRDKGNTPNSQAYFCKKCYKVFFKLDEYNAHTATVCLGGGSDGGDPPIVTVAGNVGRRSYQKQPKITPAEVARKIVAEQAGDAEAAETVAIAEGVLSPTGRPVRHCVREVRTYNDDVERIEVQTPPTGGVGRFSCGICASVFPNIHSRNSHMRIHKAGQFKQQHVSTSAAGFAAAIANSASSGGGVVMGGPPPLKAGPSVLQQMQRQKQMMVQQQYGASSGSNGGGLAQKIVNSLRQQKQAHQQAQFQQAVQMQRARQRQLEANYQQNMSKGRNQQHHNIGSAQRPVLHRPKLIKEEPIEPLVEIHEDEEDEEEVLEMPQAHVPEQDYPRNVGSVSITPIASGTREAKERQRGSQQQSVRPDIMRLVQNNPHLSIKPKAGTSSAHSSTQGQATATSSSRASGNTGMVMTMNNGGTPRRQYGTGPHAMRTLQRAAAQQQAHTQAQMQLQQQLMQQQQQIAAVAGGGGDGGSPPDGDKIYRCSSCNVPFQNKSHLYFHKKNQCGGSKYPCPFCKKRFGTEAAYSSHIFYSHPI